MTLDKEEGPPRPEGASLKSARVTGPLEHPPPPTEQHYTPDITGEKGERWAKVPAQASHLAYPLLRVLHQYSTFANGKTRIAVVSENRIAVELKWFYTSKKTGQQHPHRRKVWAKRKELEALGFILPAGKRCILGKWLDAFVVSPYTEVHAKLADKWQLQTYVTRAFSRSGAPSGDDLMHPLRTPDAPSEGHLVHPEKVHIQRFTDLRTEVAADKSLVEGNGKGNPKAVSEWLDRTSARRRTRRPSDA